MIDCTIIGGGAAGLQAALVLGRARRATMLFDTGEQNNLPTHGIGGLLGYDGVHPSALYAQGRKELAQYPTVALRDERVIAVERDGDTFRVNGEPTRRLVLATGIDYGIPAIEGIDGLWGDTVIHCPFCHGWELRDKAWALLQPDDEHAARLLGILGNWSADVIRVTEPIARLEADAGKLARIVLESGEVLERQALLIGPSLAQRTPFAEQLGLTLTGMGMVETGPFAATSDPHVFAAGDAANMPSIQTAIQSGAMAGAGVVFSLG